MFSQELVIYALMESWANQYNWNNSRKGLDKLFILYIHISIYIYICYWAEHRKTFTSFLPLCRIHFQTGNRVSQFGGFPTAELRAIPAVPLFFLVSFAPFFYLPFLFFFLFLVSGRAWVEKENTKFIAQSKASLVPVAKPSIVVVLHLNWCLIPREFSPFAVKAELMQSNS